MSLDWIWGFYCSTSSLILSSCHQGRLSERWRKKRHKKRGRRNSQAQQGYLIDQFVINLLPQAVVVRLCSVKGFYISQMRKCLTVWAYRAISERVRLKHSKLFSLCSLFIGQTHYSFIITFHWSKSGVKEPLQSDFPLF